MNFSFIKNFLPPKKSPIQIGPIDQHIPKQTLKMKWPKPSQLKYLTKFLSSKEKWIIRGLLTTAILSLILILFLSHHSDSQFKTIPAIGGTYTEGIVGFPQYVNPLLAYANEVDLDLVRLIYSSLVRYNQELELELELAKSYETNPEKNVYRFYLRENIFWHDGQPLTTDDIIFTIEKIKDPTFQSPIGKYFQNISVKKINEKTIEFILEKSNPYFLKYLTWGILPKHIWQNIPNEQIYLTEYNLKPVGSGPFKFKNLIRDKRGLIKSYTLERNDKFYKSTVYLEQITFKFFLNFDELQMALQQRELDGLYYAPKQLVEQINNLKFLRIYSLRLPHYTAIFLNQSNNEFLQSKTIRKVLSYATPKEKILNEVLGQDGIIIDGPILPGAFGYKSDIQKYNYNPEKAIKILENAGWHKNSSGYWEKDNKILSLTITTSQQPDLEKTAKIIQEAWQNIGIKTKIITFPADTIQSEIINSRNYQALLFGVVEKFDSDHYALWHSSQTKYPGLNLSLFSNQRVDELLEKARILPFEEARKKKYFELQDIIAEEVPSIFLYSNNYSYPVTDKIKNINVQKINLPSDRFNNIENWYIKTKKIKNDN